MGRFISGWIFAAAWFLSACTPGVIAADEQGMALENLPQIGLVNPTLARHYSDRALTVADEHCRQFGRFARLKWERADRIYYACVD